MEEWKEYNFTKIATIISGGTPKTSNREYWDGDIPWLSVKDFGNDLKYVYTTERQITKLGLDNSPANILSKDDIILSARGTVGELSMIPFPMSFNQSCFGLRAKDIVAAPFLYYLMKTKVRELKNNSHGSVFDTITRATLDNLTCRLPSLNLQKQIARCLSTLDDKIELNRKINDNLEQQAQALYKSWFVDFEPFKDGNFVESDLGLIPEGWSVGNLLDVAELYDSKRKPLSGMQRSAMKKIYPYYGATSIMDYVDNYIFDGIYLLMGEDGSVVTDDGYPFLQYVSGKFWPNNHAHVMQGKNGYSTEMLHCFLLKKNISEIVTGAVQAKISQGNMKKISLVIAPNEVLNEFAPVIDRMYSKMRAIHFENQQLETIRDTLVPKLMSGELKINEIDC